MRLLAREAQAKPCTQKAAEARIFYECHSSIDKQWRILSGGW